MKKIMILFVLVAAAAMTLASCQKNEISGPVKQEVYFTIKADFEETKTAITDNGDKTYTPTWANGDKIGVLFALEEKAQAVEFANTADAGETATFEGKHAFTVVEGASEVSGNLYAFYPSSAFDKEKTIYSNGEIRLDLNVRQNPTSTSFDPSCDLMIAKPCYYVAEATGESVEVLVDDMYFARMMSVLRINLNSTHLSNETVKSVSFDAEGLDLTGAMRFNLETGKFVGNLSTSQDLSEVTAVYSEEDPIYVAGEKNSAYLVVAPVTIPSGTTLTFTIETENYDIVKTVTAPADMVMPAGNIAVINLTISEDDCATKDNSDYSGTYIVVAKKSDIYYYMSTLKDGGLSGNNRTAISSGVSEITDYTSSKTDFAGVEETCVWNVAKVDGGYTFANMDNTNYLYTTDANRAMMGTVDQASIFTVSVENNIYTITDNVYYRTLSLNTSSDLFACYGSGQNPELTLIPYVADTTPRITVEDTEYNVSADDETLEFSYTTKNIDGTPTVSVADGATMKNVEADAEAGIVTVIFDANAEEVEKTATLVLSYEGAESVSVTITQAAKDVSSEGGEESIIYSTEFNYAIKGTAYNSSTEIEGKDEAGTSWGIVYGNWNGSSCAQLRVYSAGNFGSIYMKFDVANATKVSYKAKVSNTALKLNTYYSVDSGATWTKVNDSKSLSTSLTDYEFTISETGEYSKVRIKFEAAGTKPSSGNYQLTIDDVVIYGFKNGSGETPADPVQLTMSEITCSAQTENSLTFNWTAVANATGYEVTCNNKTETVNDVTYTATGLTASTQYTISVKAVGDGTNYTTSEAKTQTGTTAAAQGGGDEGGETTGGYTLVTSLSDITTGQYVIAAKVDGTYYAMSNTYSSKINGTAVTVTDNIISESDANNYVVTITKTGDNYTIQLSGKYLSYGTSGTNFSSSTTSYNWNIVVGTYGSFRIKATTGSNRAIMWQQSGSRFGPYATTNTSEYNDIELFKLAN
ncbi:MAG: fibronectin type III domain-containing protein [Bacteroidales bacterium]|nr:fibronectin type III domain-containing protein [Bacteroidales bacterium]